MKMNRESAVIFTNAISEMVRNSFIDDAPPLNIIALVNCNDCNDFHMYVFNAGDVLSAMSPSSMLSSMLFDSTSGNELLATASKGIGASIAAQDKEVIAVSVVASGGDVRINDDIDVELKTNEELQDIIHKITESDDDSIGKIIPSLSITTHTLPNIYYGIVYEVEMIGENDVMLARKDDIEGTGAGNMFDIHKSIFESAKFVGRVSLVPDCNDESPSVTDPEYSEKFHSIINKIETALLMENIS